MTERQVNYDVIEWMVEPDTNLNESKMDFGWTLVTGAPPARVLAASPLEAIQHVGYTESLRRIRRPDGEEGQFFKVPDFDGLTGNVFQVVEKEEHVDS